MLRGRVRVEIEDLASTFVEDLYVGVGGPRFCAQVNCQRHLAGTASEAVVVLNLLTGTGAFDQFGTEWRWVVAITGLRRRRAGRSPKTWTWRSSFKFFRFKDGKR